jgi:hypothetical protein
MFRDLIITKTDVISVISSLPSQNTLSMSLIKSMCWLTSNISRFKKLKIENIQNLLMVIKCGLAIEGEDEIKSDCLWAASYISDTNDDGVLELIASGDSLL